MQPEDIVNQLTADINEVVNTIINNKITIPKFKDIKSKDQLYSSYGKIVEDHDYVTRKLILISKASLDLDTFKEELDQGAYLTIAAKAKTFKIIKEGKEKLKEFTGILTIYKDNLTAVLRFYGSAQYILGSTRFEEYS